MTTQQLTFQIPPYGTATLTLPEMLTSDTFARLDSAIGRVLAEPQHPPGDSSGADPGSVEFDSWLVDRH